MVWMVSQPSATEAKARTNSRPVAAGRFRTTKSDPVATAAAAKVTAKMMALVNENYPIFVRWITDEELIANPGIVKSKNVRPPMGLGRVSLVCIGEDSAVDSQPCGGTHVSETQEVGAIHIAKIEKKGKENRRFRIRFGTPAGEN